MTCDICGKHKYIFWLDRKENKKICAICVNNNLRHDLFGKGNLIVTTE